MELTILNYFRTWNVNLLLSLSLPTDQPVFAHFYLVPFHQQRRMWWNVSSLTLPCFSYGGVASAGESLIPKTKSGIA